MVLVSLLTHHLRLPSVSDKEIESLILFLVFFSELQVEEGAGLTLARYSAVIMKQTDRQTDRQTVSPSRLLFHRHQSSLYQMHQQHSPHHEEGVGVGSPVEGRKEGGGGGECEVEGGKKGRRRRKKKRGGTTQLQ